MSNEERNHLWKEVEEIRTTLETLRPDTYEQPRSLDVDSESRRAKLATLRKELARDMERLHAENSY
jgi:hypothetical protein